jgi:hypothetical protein
MNSTGIWEISFCKGSERLMTAVATAKKRTKVTPIRIVTRRRLESSASLFTVQAALTPSSTSFLRRALLTVTMATSEAAKKALSRIKKASKANPLILSKLTLINSSQVDRW